MVYWDRVVVLNGIVDYLLLLSAAWLSGLPLRRGRLVLWAALGGLYAGAVFLPGLEVLGVPVIRAAAGIAMALGAMKWRWRPAGVFLLLAARSDYIEVTGRRYPRTPVALSEQPVSDGGGYHALWGAAEERGRGHEAVDVAEAAVAQSAKAG